MPQTGVGGTVRQTLRGVLAASDQAPSEFRACFYREQVLREYLLGQDLVLYEAETLATAYVSVQDRAPE